MDRRDGIGRRKIPGYAEHLYSIDKPIKRDLRGTFGKSHILLASASKNAQSFSWSLQFLPFRSGIHACDRCKKNRRDIFLSTGDCKRIRHEAFFWATIVKKTDANPVLSQKGGIVRIVLPPDEIACISPKEEKVQIPCIFGRLCPNFRVIKVPLGICVFFGHCKEFRQNTSGDRCQDPRKGRVAFGVGPRTSAGLLLPRSSEVRQETQSIDKYKALHPPEPIFRLPAFQRESPGKLDRPIYLLFSFPAVFSTTHRISWILSK